MGLKNTLYEIAKQYEVAKKDDLTEHHLAKVVRDGLPQEIRDILGIKNDSLEVKGSVGIGAWADVPWCAIFNPLITESVTSGYYLVYLFYIKNDKIYLSLNQGATNVRKEFKKNTIEVLKERASLYRSYIYKYKYKKNLIITPLQDLTGKLGKYYAAGNILGFEYEVKSLSNENFLHDDFKFMVDAYSALIFQDKENYKSDLDEIKNDRLLNIEETRKYKQHFQIERKAGTAKKSQGSTWNNMPVLWI